jgi:hypothetical protein
MTQTCFRGLSGKYEVLRNSRRNNSTIAVREKRRKLPPWSKTAFSYKKKSKTPPAVFIPNQLTPTHSIAPYFSKVRFNIIVPNTAMSPEWLLLLMLYTDSNRSDAYYKFCPSPPTFCHWSNIL